MPSIFEAPIRVLLVTSDRNECGIREYGRFLMASVPPHLATIEEYPETNPIPLMERLCNDCPTRFLGEIIHLNHHAALHSRWTREHVEAIRQLGYGVVVTQHDTFETAQIMWERGFTDFRSAHRLFVHEPIEGLRMPGMMRAFNRALGGVELGNCDVVYLRQPIPTFELYPGPVMRQQWTHTLGLAGFDFPWKGFDLAIQAASAAGWGVLLFSPNLTIERGGELQRLHPFGLEIVPLWLSAERIVQGLSACDASAFLYTTGNSGTSAAIRLGIAADRPVVAATGCRQFRDLLSDPLAARALSWVRPTVDEVARELHALAHKDYWEPKRRLVAELHVQDSWARAGHLYGMHYKDLGGKVRVHRAGREGRGGAGLQG